MTSLQHTVLIVDDNPEDRVALRRALQRDLGTTYTYYEATTAAEGLARSRELRPDVVLLDYLLPDGDGLAVLDELVAEHGPHAFAVLMLTGNGDEQLAATALKLGAHDYLSKGAQLGQQLSRAIAGAIEKAGLQRDIARQRSELEASNAQLQQALAALSNERRLLNVTLASIG